jgi:hypothetical protein
VPESFNFDLFISYSRYDNREGYISELVARIQKEYRDFTGGAELPRLLRERRDRRQGRPAAQDSRWHSLESSAAGLPLTYLESEYSSWEFHEYLRCQSARGPLVESIGPIYFVEIPAWSDKGFEQRAAEWVPEFRRRRHFAFLPWFDQGAADLKEAVIRALLKAAGARASPAAAKG